MNRNALRLWIVGGISLATMLGAPLAWGVSLDKDDTIKLGMRSYVSARIGTEATDKNFLTASQGGQVYSTLDARTFPESPAGHLRQNRFFLELELEHDLTRLKEDGFGPLALLNHLPFRVDGLKYKISFRGEGEGIYDWGPSEFRTGQSMQQLLGDASGRIDPPDTCTLQACPNIARARHELHKNGSNRERLYQAYLEATIADDLFIRLGRQILVWGETDNFRLMDNINPIDSSFGGFLIDLDERRVPIDMLRMSYHIGELGEAINEMSLEGYAAIDNKVSYYPGALKGSAWTFPNSGTPEQIPPGSTRDDFILRPPRNIPNTRGGVRLIFNAYDITFSLAHYYTVADLPAAQTCVGKGFPAQKVSLRDSQRPSPLGGSGPIEGCRVPIQDQAISQRPACISDGPDGIPGTADDLPAGCRPAGTYDVIAPIAYAVQVPQRMQVSGATATFVVPATLSRRVGLSGEPVVRTELAYFKDEPSYTQAGLDPFSYHFQGDNQKINQASGIETRDSINFVLGIDTNQFVRFLNPVNSFFISTQFFYKHIKNAPNDALPAGCQGFQCIQPGLVLPVPAAWVSASEQPTLGAIRPVFVKNSPDQFLQTLFISTSYRGGSITPNFTLLYDWSGALTYIPAVTFLHDPFRFTMEYDLLDAGGLKGNSGVSLLRDRDNFLFRFEYVI